jgi:hypothetical protein
MEELNNERFKESVGSEEDASEEERRAMLAFKVFEEIYAFARDTWYVNTFIVVYL